MDPYSIYIYSKRYAFIMKLNFVSIIYTPNVTERVCVPFYVYCWKLKFFELDQAIRVQEN